MDVQKNKAIRRVVQCFLVFLALCILEELVIIPHVINTMHLISSVGGLIVLLIYIRFINKPLDEIGMIFSGHKVRKGILLAFLLNLAPAAIVYLWEYRILSLQGGAVFSLYYDKPARSFSSAGPAVFLAWAVACLMISVVEAFFYELSFRGLLITLGSRSLHFYAINIIQAALFTVWYLMRWLSLVVYQSDKYTTNQIIYLLVIILVYEIMTALKLGLLRFSTGSVWACIFDHIGFGFIMEIVHLNDDSRYYTRIIAYQAIALIITYVYYVYKKKKIHEMQQEAQMQANN
ncbi:MAG: CPBP family intramembrane metalloprotease [Clostridia bacterium]|nr:CPBP family intramembrane metalloprotease [Clostridia bacterium]